MADVFPGVYELVSNFIYFCTNQVSRLARIFSRSVQIENRMTVKMIRSNSDKLSLSNKRRENCFFIENDITKYTDIIYEGKNKAIKLYKQYNSIVSASITNTLDQN
jgi:hypothetical protein